MLDTVEVVARETKEQSAFVKHDFREVPIYALQESPTNPRRSFDEAKLYELAQSIRSQGVLVPLIVRDLDLDRFEVVAGARRFRAARLAELASVPVRVITHVYQRLRLAELIPDAAEVFQANQITAGHAVLIARLPQEQQKDALAATFREDWRTKLGPNNKVSADKQIGSITSSSAS